MLLTYFVLFNCKLHFIELHSLTKGRSIANLIIWDIVNIMFAVYNILINEVTNQWITNPPMVSWTKPLMEFSKSTIPTKMGPSKPMKSLFLSKTPLRVWAEIRKFQGWKLASSLMRSIKTETAKFRSPNFLRFWKVSSVPFEMIKLILLSHMIAIWWMWWRV
jgi:hypothetical protein